MSLNKYFFFYIVEDGDEGQQRSKFTTIKISEEEAEELSKNSTTDLSLSEKILIESASEKDRISEIQVDKQL